jgi:predicted ATPase
MLSKMRLQNFKCFEDEEINLTPFNLLTGLNGMGKSTVIQAFLLLRQNYDLKLLENGIALNGELIQIGNSKDLLYQYFTSREIGIHITTDNNETASWKWNAETNMDYLPVKKEDIQINKAIFNQSLFNENFHYLHAERIGPRVYFETSTHKVMNQNQLGIRGEFAINYLSLFQNDPIPLKQLKHPNTEGLTLYEQINAWLGEIRPGTRISVSSNLDMSLLGLSYQFIGGLDVGNKFRPTNVGFGISYLLPVLVAVLSSRPGSLILIENPEAHLHPKGQVQIGRLLAMAAANGVQIILETHSDHILNGARVAVKEKIIRKEQTNILFFTGDIVEDTFKHYILNPIIDDKGRIDYWPEGFFDEWEKQLINLM